MAPKKLMFVTGNVNKLAEVREILGDVIEVENRNVDLDELQGTIEQITKDKCKRAAEILKGPVLVEDTCLAFKAMGELPGPYIKWFLKELGPDNLHKMLAGFDDKSAEAICTFGYSEGPGHEPIIFQGRTEGKLVPARGPPTFGWDPAFEVNGTTYAEMDKEEKNKISHRSRALAKLSNWLEEHTA
ncbi:inosine triphosphate pyrophosphatase-like protein [Microthyrium microscopicum]|uniref:Inosine triphosphate pyrophosphatase n=1 Tax=Microthyrium microscopicum TaxID=703497 RepID=A0A6A6UAH2_9PEZI|nr:inosine triphosphate pyrophosphatase-like protein [Microthyrium microscopicum]